MLKRTFIPPSHRPQVRGARLAAPDAALAAFHAALSCDLERRRLIIDLVQGRATLGGLDPEVVRTALLELFPALAPLSEAAR